MGLKGVSKDMDGISPEAKARLQHVADLMLAIYKTRAEMRYINAAAIKPGPHDIAHLLPFYQSLGLDPAIIYLYSILPYVDEAEAGQREFYMGGTWFNHLDKDQVRNGRDPFFLDPEGDDFSDPKGAYMRPWFTPLSVLCERQQVIVYDAKADRIWTIDQGSWRNEDPGLRNSRAAARNGNAPYSSGDGDDDAIPNGFSHMPARSAVEVLHDIYQWFRTHRIPFHTNPDWSDSNRFDTTIAQLYAQHGWPHHFDGDAFEVGRLRRWAVARVRDDEGLPARRLEEAQESVDYGRERVAQYKKKAARARTPKARWAAQFEALKASRNMQTAVAEVEHERANMERLGQGPQGDSVAVREYRILRHRLQTLPDPSDIARMAAAAEGRDAQIRRQEKEFRTLQKALEAVKEDVERQFPGQAIDLDSARDISAFDEDGGDRAWGRELVGILESDIASYRAWVAGVPEDLTEVRRSVEEAIALAETNIEGLRGQGLGEPV